MLNFRKLTLNDMDAIKPYYSYSHNRTCDDTPGTTIMWRDYFETEYAIFNETLLFKVKYLEKSTAFTIPMGPDIDGAILAIQGYCKANDLPLVFCAVTQEDEKVIQQYFSYTKTEERDWFDYLYNSEDLANLTGKKYNGQRNHINYFKKAFPDYRLEKITRENIEDVKTFFDKITQDSQKTSKSSIEESNKVVEVLNNYQLYGMVGGVLYTEGNNIAAFAIGEQKYDTFFVHIEKADITYRGAYQMIVNEFAKYYVTPEIKYINREEDVGDEGLRRSKMSYHPCCLLEKYTVLVN